MRYGLIGGKLGHSFSKEIHERLGLYEYELKEVSDLDGFMTQRDFAGINVTIPYKQAVLPHLSSTSPKALEIGAVNTIVNHGGELLGYNTDYDGLKGLVERMGLDLSGRTVLIAGTGGTSRTALAVARDLGAAVVRRLSRTGREDAITYDRAYEECASADILINTTPCGMYPDSYASPFDLDRFESLEGVVDVVYNPLCTRLVQEARARGIRAENGLYMLVHQAVSAAELFTGQAFQQGVVDRIYGELLFEKRNIVLIGMPSSGKTTIGLALAAKLGRECVDTDDAVIARASMPITEIFRTHGEAFFRDLESEVVRDLSRSGGKVIATGGGVPLRDGNIDALKSNGVIVFLDRPLADLVPTDDRPLSSDADQLVALYGERRPIYEAAADHRIPVRGAPADTVEELLGTIR